VHDAADSRRAAIYMIFDCTVQGNTFGLCQHSRRQLQNATGEEVVKDSEAGNQAETH
jgi:hypothetical protein